MNVAAQTEIDHVDAPWSLAQPNTRRSLLLAATGALAGLIIAGFGLFSAAGTRTSMIPPEDVAVVNGVPILRVDYSAQLRALDDVSLSQASAQQKHAVLNDMIAEELAVQRGVELGMPTDDTDTRSALVAAVRGQLATDVLAQVPTDDQLHRYFDAHRANYASEGRMTLHWLTGLGGTRAAFVAAAASLRHGASVDQVIANSPLTSTGKVDDGEEYYFAAAIHLGPKLFAIAKTLKDGEVAGPIVTRDGLNLLVMAHNQPPIGQNFDEARSRVREDYARDRLASVEAANARFLRSRADVSIASDLR